MKALFKGVSLVVCFLGVWFLLSQLDYITFFKIDKAISVAEKSIGDLIWDDLKRTQDIIVNDSITKELDKLLKPL